MSTTTALSSAGAAPTATAKTAESASASLTGASINCNVPRAHCAGARGPILWNAGFQQELVDFARENDLLVERQQQRRHEEQEEMITR